MTGDRLVGHLARANMLWWAIVDGAPGLAVVQGPDAYVCTRRGIEWSGAG